MPPMRTLWKLAIASALALTAVLAIPGPAAAYHNGNVSTVSGTVADNNVAIPMNNYTGYTFSLAAGGSIQYGIQNSGGAENFDVFLFDAAGLALYRADPPQSAQAVESHLANNQFGGVFTVGPAGSYTVVLDNVGFSGAVPTGPISVQVALVRLGGGTPTPDFLGGLLAVGLAICVGLIAVVVIVLFLIIYFVTHREKPPMPPPGPPYMPPPQQWPPQQPPPQAPPEPYPPQYPPQNP